MRFADIPSRSLTFRVKRTDGATGSLPEGPVLSVAPCPTRPGEFELRVKDSLIFVKPVSDTDTRRLTTELASGCAILAQLVNPAADSSVELHVAFFAGDCLDMGAVEVGADEYVEQRYANITRSREPLSGKPLYEALAKRCCYYHGDQPFFFFFAGPAVDRTLHPEVEESKDEEPEERAEESHGNDASNVHQPDAVMESSSRRPEPTRKNSMCIIGDGIRFIATETVRPDGKSIYIATGLTKVRGEPDRALRLAKGKLTFSDWTQAGQIQMLTKAQMLALTRDDGSYLKRWDEFVAIEGELVLAQARKIGTLEYSDMVPNRDGTVTVRITQSSDSALETLAAGDVESIEMANDLPEYLTNADVTFSQFTGVIEKEAESEAFFGKRGNQRKESTPHYDIADYDAITRTLTLKTESLPASGTLILSLAGQIAQIKRRLFARKAILEGRAANPQLGLLIEDKGVIAQIRSPSKIKPLTAFVTDKVFRNPPTERQREAISVALNTPDIALIQGPPGTGKTTVIAAIIERLSEMADKRGGSVKGSVLLTGLQHDAVENMIERLSLNGLPVPKFGRRSGSEEDDFSAFERKLQGWCMERASALRAKNPRLADIEQETQIKNLCLQYLKAPTRALALNIAKRIANLDIIIVGEECARRAANLANRLSLEEQLNADSDPLLEDVRRLRHRPEAFLDDGPERAADALDDLSDVLEADDRNLLEKASLWRNEDGIPPFLNEVAAVKKRLLSRFTVPPVFRVEKQNDEVVALVEEASKRIRTGGVSAKDAKSAALAEFLAELESNPYGMMDAVSDYAYAFAATCQQSVNRQMQRQKGITADNPALEFQKIEYEHVIVDEAARVTPPDLMVAMAQGKRIILVGDHRQLPHIIDEAVAQQMEAGEAGRQEAEWLKKSMFQHLFSERLTVLEEADGIPRRVTLDKQYRMHPLLGEFVSRNFYERFDPSERFGSGRPESDFAHRLPGTDGSPAVWLDVPAAKGKHLRKKGETSWTRPAESIAIAHQLHAWMNSKEGQDLSFGVISFYKAQAELIKKQLGSLAKSQDKLRIGTVDSFQGMEFDVVILSMVRTMQDNWRPRSDDEEKQARGLFGHLCLYNRLNVSMSRQKKMLAVAGDPELLRNDLSVKFIPALVDFYSLCQTHGRVLPCR
jgi:hypothetical protein